jgi:hypothetical protein
MITFEFEGKPYQVSGEVYKEEVVGIISGLPGGRFVVVEAWTNTPPITPLSYKIVDEMTKEIQGPHGIYEAKAL